MQFSLATLLLFLPLITLAQDVESNDVPSQCKAVCKPIVQLTAQCDNKFDDDDNGQLNCVCNANNAATQLPLCEACYAEFSNDGHDNDVHDLVTKCSFTTTTYNTASSTAMTTGSSMSTSASTTVITGTRETASMSSSAAPSAQSTGAAARVGGLDQAALGLIGAMGVLAL